MSSSPPAGAFPGGQSEAVAMHIQRPARDCCEWLPGGAPNDRGRPLISSPRASCGPVVPTTCGVPASAQPSSRTSCLYPARWPAGNVNAVEELAVSHSGYFFGTDLHRHQRPCLLLILMGPTTPEVRKFRNGDFQFCAKRD